MSFFMLISLGACAPNSWVAASTLLPDIVSYTIYFNILKYFGEIGLYEASTKYECGNANEHVMDLHTHLVY